MPVADELLKGALILETAANAGMLALRIIPLLVAAVFMAEAARLWLGDEKLRNYLAGRSSWTGRLRAAGLGAVLPFCECGAFPVMLGLIRAGVPAGAVLTFFLVSPVVSMPAFMILVGVFGLPLALFYLIITSSAALAAGFLLEPAGRRWGMFKSGIAVGEEKKVEGSLAVASGSGSCGAEEGSSCCSDAAGLPEGAEKKDLLTIAGLAWNHTTGLLRRIAPYVAVVIAISALLQNLAPQELIKQALAERAPFDVLIGALIGIPVYSGDCAMIALAAPLIGATGAVAAGIAFIISGSGTSINGIIFMSSVFKRRFLVLYVGTVFCIALVVGYIITFLLAIGLL